MKKSIFLISILAMLLVACGGMESDAPDDAPQGAANESAPNLVPPRDDAAHRLENPAGATEAHSTVPFDVRYIEMMIEHHLQGLGMARVAVSEAQSEEIREMAQDMVDMHETEIEQLQAWLAEWYPDRAESSSEHTPGSLVLEGESFDRAFLKAMVAHHSTAYQLSREALRRAEHQELIEFAQHIMDTQAAQMDHMQQMLVDTE